MLWLERGSTEEKEREYISKYGESKVANEFIKYEELTGVNWADVFIQFKLSDEEYSLIDFHKNVVLKLLYNA